MEAFWKDLGRVWIGFGEGLGRVLGRVLEGCGGVWARFLIDLGLEGNKEHQTIQQSSKRLKRFMHESFRFGIVVFDSCMNPLILKVLASFFIDFGPLSIFSCL